MADLTRRGFLQTGMATGAASIGTITLGSGLAAAALATVGVTAAELSARSNGQPLVAYVRDAARGEMTVLLGHREVSLRDPDLVLRLLKAAH
jgi:tetrahydromethanopterin S-methyltransferase subunit C